MFFFLFHWYENIAKTVPQTRTATATTTITCHLLPLTHRSPTQTQAAVAADNVTTCNSSRASSSSSSTADSIFLSNCYESITKWLPPPPPPSPIAHHPLPISHKHQYQWQWWQCPSPVVHCPLTSTPTVAAWPRSNTTHNHTDHAIIHHPSPVTSHNCYRPPPSVTRPSPIAQITSSGRSLLPRIHNALSIFTMYYTL